MVEIKIEVNDILLSQFHHTHHENGNHIIHHCGGNHGGIEHTKDYKIHHCIHNKHAINKKKITAKLEQFEHQIVDFIFTEQCKENYYHIENAKITSSKNTSSQTAFLHGFHDSTKFLLSNDYLKSPILDFGCGLGIEAELLSKMGFEVIKYDPFYFPSLNYRNKKYKTIICSYVLQTLPQHEERNWIINNCIALADICYFIVRRGFYHDYNHRIDLPMQIFKETEEYCIYKTKG